MGSSNNPLWVYQGSSTQKRITHCFTNTATATTTEDGDHETMLLAPSIPPPYDGRVRVYLVMVYLVSIYLVRIYLVRVYLVRIYLVRIYLVMVYLVMVYLVRIYLVRVCLGIQT